MQIDLLIDRHDGVINLCEIKFASQPFILDHSYKNRLIERSTEFAALSKTRKITHTTLIAPYGLAHPENHGDVIQNVVLMDDLFQNL